eukprot:9199100-Lingulodinium_polyedra.AAC.1
MCIRDRWSSTRSARSTSAAGACWPLTRLSIVREAHQQGARKGRAAEALRVQPQPRDRVVRRAARGRAVQPGERK